MSPARTIMGMGMGMGFHGLPGKASASLGSMGGFAHGAHPPYLRLLVADAGRPLIAAPPARHYFPDGHDPAMTSPIDDTAQAIVADGKGVLAADETVSTLTRRLAALTIQSTM